MCVRHIITGYCTTLRTNACCVNYKNSGNNNRSRASHTLGNTTKCLRAEMNFWFLGPKPKLSSGRTNMKPERSSRKAARRILCAWQKIRFRCLQSFAVFCLLSSLLCCLLTLRHSPLALRFTFVVQDFESIGFYF